MINKFLATAALALLGSCLPKEKTNQFSDPVLAKIADLQDKRFSDSLYQYFSAEDAAYRSSAALAFASIQDTLASGRLGNLLLEDPSTEVKIHAAFALGQTGGYSAVNALIPAANDPDKSVVKEVLEALGKTITSNDLEFLRSYPALDSSTQEGLAWAYYRLGLRRIADSIINIREVKFLETTYTTSTRRAAAQYFSRAPVKGAFFEKNIIQSALHDPDPEVRMNSLSALKKIKNDAAFEVIKSALSNEVDYRCRVNAVRALQPFPYEKSRPLFFQALKDSSSQVGVAAAELLGTLLKTSDTTLLAIARTCTNGRIQAVLYEALLSTEPGSIKMIEEVKGKFAIASNNYQKAQLLSALSKAKNAYQFIYEQLMASRDFVVKSTAAQALADNYHPDLPLAVREDFLTMYKAAIADGDPAVIGTLAGSLADSLMKFRALIKDVTFLEEAKKKLHLPKDVESLQPLEEALAYLQGKPKPLAVKTTFNHPIDWNLVKTIPVGQRAVINTAKGEIILELLVNEAPGSVANFVDLTKRKYYDNRFVHRVVPNFVMQTGCNRGDGFGSEDYSIRSEFSMRHYSQGSVGYASAGKDTEGTQWFITHSSTPHLDGRYTIFARVISGMEVADRIEVGEQILSLRLIPN